jgi:4-amino-4-deoxy-L-arabinose transferase-like glycosyltransferase
LILLAAGLRFYRLSAQDIWGDEAFSISLSSRSLGEVVAGGADTHPPFYPALLFFWMRLVRSPAGAAGAFSTRALSALAGVLVIPLLFVFARRLTSRRAAWLAAGLAAISPLLVYYSQETRMYELVALLSLASAFFGVCLVDRTPRASRARDIAAYLISTALAFYTHYSAFFVWVAQNVYAAVRLRKDGAALARWAILQLTLIAVYIPWVWVQSGFLQGKRNTRFEEWGWQGVELVWGKTALAFAAGLTLDAPFVQMAAVLFMILAAIGAWAALSMVHQSPGQRLAPVALVVPVAIAWVVNPIMPFFFERYVLVALPAFYVTVALGLDYIARRWMYAALPAAGICILVSAVSLSNYYWNDAYAKGKYGQMMAYVQENVQARDALILNNPLQKPLFDYYRPRGVPAFFLPEDAPLEDPRTRQQLDDIAHDHERLWLVMFGNPAEYDPTGYLERWLGAHAFKSFARGYVDASLSLYVMPSAAPAVQRPVGATLGGNIQLLGYALDSAEIVPGQILRLTLHWRANGAAEKRYQVFTHLIGAENPATQSPVWAQMDGEPVGGSHPTTLWQPGEIIDDLYGLAVPPNAPPGDYVLEVGMYDPATLARLPVRDASGVPLPDDRVVLGTVRVRGK